MTGPSRVDPEPVASAIQRLRQLLAAKPPLVVVSDFDGTLSPIVAQPGGAVIDPLARSALRRLARIAVGRPDRLRLVVLSGRTAIDVATRVRVGGLRYLGNHGIEASELARRGRPERLAVETEAAVLAYVEPARALAEHVADALGRPDWLFVEMKGPTIAFHYRQADDPEAAQAAIVGAAAEQEQAAGPTGLVRFDGRRVVEFRPAAGGGKGDALERLMERDRPGAILILGDDRSDAEAFEAARRARSEGRLEAVIVGVHGAVETPPEVLAGADLVLATPHDAARLLAALARSLANEDSVSRASAARPA